MGSTLKSESRPISLTTGSSEDMVFENFLDNVVFGENSQHNLRAQILFSEDQFISNNEFSMNFFVDKTNSIGDLSLAKQVIAFPNPFNNTLNLVVNGLNKGIASLTSVEGKIVWRSEINGGDFKTEISTEQLPAGIYFLTVTDGNRTFAAKFVKQ
jgi:hypothetical protein